MASTSWDIHEVSIEVLLKEVQDDQQEEIIKKSCDKLSKLLEYKTPVSSDAESALSFQEDDTDFPHDTPFTDSASSTEIEQPSSNNYEEELETTETYMGSVVLTEISTGNEAPLNLTALPNVPHVSASEHKFTDHEYDFDSSFTEVSELKKTKWNLCVKCKELNANPLYQFCRRCFRKRKELFPPRPKGFKRRADLEEKINKKRKTNFYSNDSGVGVGLNTQTEQIDLRKTLLSADGELESKSPKRLKINTQLIGSNNLPASAANEKYHQVPDVEVPDFCKKANNETSGCDEVIKSNKKTVIIEKDEGEEETHDRDNKDLKKEDDVLEQENNASLNASKELCIMCATLPRDSVFLHGTTAHFSCCYFCAMKTWKTTKCCPVCKKKVQTIVKIYT